MKKHLVIEHDCLALGLLLDVGPSGTLTPRQLWQLLSLHLQGCRTCRPAPCEAAPTAPSQNSPSTPPPPTADAPDPDEPQRGARFDRQFATRHCSLLAASAENLNLNQAFRRGLVEELTVLDNLLSNLLQTQVQLASLPPEERKQWLLLPVRLQGLLHHERNWIPSLQAHQEAAPVETHCIPTPQGEGSQR